MAKSQLNFTKSVTNKVSVKGVLSDDGTTITYLDENKEEQEIKVSDCLLAFRDSPINFSVSFTTDEELEIEVNDYKNNEYTTNIE